MARPTLQLALALAACIVLEIDAAAASQPTMDECFEASDFIGNAALSRDAGVSAEAFLQHMQQDFSAIHAFPPELRWFAHDADDEAFLYESARTVFDEPLNPQAQRAAFLRACLDRMSAVADAVAT